MMMPSLSSRYIAMEVVICLTLLKQEVARAISRALAKTGKRIDARIAMIAMTTRSSIRVKALRPTGREAIEVRITVVISSQPGRAAQRSAERSRTSKWLASLDA